MDKAFVEHQGRQQLRIQEDPWDNYLYFDAKYILPLICHHEPLSVAEEVVICSFLCLASQDATISQFDMTSRELSKELLSFVASQEDDDADDDTTTLMDKIRHLCEMRGSVRDEDVKAVHSELERTFKMFYLKQ